MSSGIAGNGNNPSNGGGGGGGGGRSRSRSRSRGPSGSQTPHQPPPALPPHLGTSASTPSSSSSLHMSPYSQQLDLQQQQIQQQNQYNDFIELQQRGSLQDFRQAQHQQQQQQQQQQHQQHRPQQQYDSDNSVRTGRESNGRALSRASNRQPDAISERAPTPDEIALIHEKLERRAMAPPPPPQNLMPSETLFDGQSFAQAPQQVQYQQRGYASSIYSQTSPQEQQRLQMAHQLELQQQELQLKLHQVQLQQQQLMLQQQHLELMGGPSLGNHSVPTSRPIQPQELLRDAPGASRQPILPVSTVPPSSRYPRATARSQPQIVPLVPSLDVSRKPRSTVSPRSTHGMMVQPQPTPPGAGPYMNAPGPYLWQEASSLSSTQTPSSQYQQQYFQQGSQPYPHHQAYQNSPSAPGAPLSPPLGGPPVASTPPPVAGSPSRRSGNSLDVSGLSLNPSKTPPTVSPPINPLNVIGNRPQPLPPPIPNSGSTTPVQQSIAYSLAQGSPPALPQAPIALNPLAAMALIPIALLKEQQQPGIAPNPIPLQGPTGLRFPQSEVPSSSGAPIPNDGGKGAAPISTAAVSAGVSKTKATGTLSAPSAYSLALSTGKKKR